MGGFNFKEELSGSKRRSSSSSNAASPSTVTEAHPAETVAELAVAVAVSAETAQLCQQKQQQQLNRQQQLKPRPVFIQNTNTKTFILSWHILDTRATIG
jgi:hypothetical protein